MALISATTIITSLSLFHITLGFFFLTNPLSVADQALVYILGQAMGLPYERNFDSISPSLAFLGIVLGSAGISDLVTLSLPEEVSLLYYWGTQAPLRLLLTMTALFYSFFFSAASPFYGGTTRGHIAHPPITWGGDALKNRVFFTFMFLETISWFWIWVTLREEKDQILIRQAKKRSRERRPSY